MNEFEERYTGKGCQQRFADEIMGKKVTFTDVYERVFLESKDGCRVKETVWERLTGDEQAGWIVGSTQVYEGKYIPGYHGRTVFYNGFEEDYEQASLDVSNCVKAVLVTTWPNQKPHKVPYDSIMMMADEKT